MSRRGGDSYYVLVNNDGDVYTVEDFIGQVITVEFDTWEDAEEELEYLLDLAGEGLDKKDGWHVERHRW